MRRAAFWLLPALLATACDPIDRCLDRGGRWNHADSACELDPGASDEPGAALDRPGAGPRGAQSERIAKRSSTYDRNGSAKATARSSQKRR